MASLQGASSLGALSDSDESLTEFLSGLRKYNILTPGSSPGSDRIGRFGSAARDASPDPFAALHPAVRGSPNALQQPRSPLSLASSPGGVDALLQQSPAVGISPAGPSPLGRALSPRGGGGSSGSRNGSPVRRALRVDHPAFPSLLQSPSRQQSPLNDAAGLSCAAATVTASAHAAVEPAAADDAAAAAAAAAVAAWPHGALHPAIAGLPGSPPRPQQPPRLSAAAAAARALAGGSPLRPALRGSRQASFAESDGPPSASSSRRSIKFADEEPLTPPLGPPAATAGANGGNSGSACGSNSGVGVAAGGPPSDIPPASAAAPGSSDGNESVSSPQQPAAAEAAPPPQPAAEASADYPAPLSAVAHPNDSPGDIPDREELSQLLISCGFAALAPAPPPGVTMESTASSDSAEGGDPAVRRALAAVLLQFRQRSALLSQLLGERRDAQRGASREAGEFTRVEAERDAAVREATRAKTELLEWSSREGARLEARHREAEAKLSSEVSKLKFALKEAEAALTAARSGAAGAGSASDAAAAQARDEQRAAQRHREESDRAASEVARLKAVITGLERSLSEAQSDARRRSEAAAAAARDADAARRQREEDVAGLTGEVGRLRDKVRQAEHEVLRVKEEQQQALADAAAEAALALDTARAAHQEEITKLASELSRARQQVSDLQASEAAARAAVKAELSAAAASDKALGLEKRQQAVEAARAAADAARLRENVRQLEEEALSRKRLLDTATQQLAAAEADVADARAASEAARREVETLRGAGRRQAQLLGEEAAGLRRQVVDLEQKLASTSAELRRVRAAAGLADTLASVPPHPSAATATNAAAHANPSARAGTPTDAYNASVGVPDDDNASLAAAGEGGAAAADLAAALARAARAEAALSEAEGALTQQRYRVSLLEHAAKAKEGETERLRERLAEKVAKEERRLARDKAAYVRLRRAHAMAKRDSNGGAAAARAAAGAVAAAARELRPAEIVGVYETQREALEAELTILKQELRDAQNLAMAKDRAALAAEARAAAAAEGGAAGVGPAALREQRRAAELQREICTLRADAAEALRLANRRAAEAEARAAAAQGDADALAEELRLRPTPQEITRLRREIDLLERRLAQFKRRALAAEAGGEAEEGEGALAALAGAAGAPRGVRAQMERDRAISRLGLGVVEELPRDVMVDLLQDACIALELRDPTLLAPSLRRTLAVLSAVPSLEAFVADVCTLTFRSGLAFCPKAIVDEGINPGAAPRALEAWLRALRRGEALRTLLLRLRDAVAQSASLGGVTGRMDLSPADAITESPGDAEAAALLAGGRELIAAVEALVASEAEGMAAREAFEAARGVVKGRPEELLSRLVGHVQKLLDCPDLEGVLPSLNRLYVSHTELSNLFRSLASVLALPQDAGPSAAVAAIRRLVASCGDELAKRGTAAYNDPATPTAAAVQGETAPAPPPSAAAAAAASELAGLLSRLGARDAEAAAGQHRTLVERLARLDGLLPRYQRLAAQLFDALRVTSLDDVMPALTQRLAAGGR